MRTPRELDWLIETKIFNGKLSGEQIPHYSSVLDDAWKLFERFRMAIGLNERGMYVAWAQAQPGGMLVAAAQDVSKIAAMAIARSALRAVDVDPDGPVSMLTAPVEAVPVEVEYPVWESILAGGGQ